MGIATFLSGILFSINIRAAFGSSVLLFLLALFIIKTKFISTDSLRGSAQENKTSNTINGIY